MLWLRSQSFLQRQRQNIYKLLHWWWGPKWLYWHSVGWNSQLQKPWRSNALKLDWAHFLQFYWWNDRRNGSSDSCVFIFTLFDMFLHQILWIVGWRPVQSCPELVYSGKRNLLQNVIQGKEIKHMYLLGVTN